MEICKFPQGYVWIIPYIHMENFWKALNIFQIDWTKDILGHVFYFQPYTTSNIQKPCGNLQVSTWLCMDNSIKTHGEFLEGYKYLKTF
jgi:hypothetical protein